MVNNFEILMDFKNVRDFAICASKNNLCCNKTRCGAMLQDEKAQERCCRLCWLDFLTNDEGLNLSYLDKDESIECKTSPIKLSKKSMKILEDKKMIEVKLTSKQYCMVSECIERVSTNEREFDTDSEQTLKEVVEKFNADYMELNNVREVL